MSVVTQYYFGMPGNTTITDPQLTNVHIICVTRNGTTYYKTSGSPTNVQFSYDASSGTISFDPTQPFIERPRLGLENKLKLRDKISVKYKI